MVSGQFTSQMTKFGAGVCFLLWLLGSYRKELRHSSTRGHRRRAAPNILKHLRTVSIGVSANINPEQHFMRRRDFYRFEREFNESAAGFRASRSTCVISRQNTEYLNNITNVHYLSQLSWQLPSY